MTTEIESPKSRVRPLPSEDEDDEIINLAPLRKKPKMDISESSSDLLSRLTAFMPRMKAANEDLEVKRKAGLLDDMKLEIDDEEDEDDDEHEDEDEEDSSDGDSEASDSDSDSDSGSDADSNSDSNSDLDAKSNAVSRDHSAPATDANSGPDAGDGDQSARSNSRKPQRKKKKAAYIEMNLGLGVLEEKTSDTEKDDFQTGIANFLGLSAPLVDDEDSDSSSSASDVEASSGLKIEPSKVNSTQSQTPKRNRPIIEEIG